MVPTSQTFHVLLRDGATSEPHRERQPHTSRSVSITVPAMPNAAVKVAGVSTTRTIMKRPHPSSSSALGKSGNGAHPLAVFLWGSVISLLVLMAIASGDRVLVFLNLSDLAWTVGVVFIPLAALFVVPLTAGMMLPKTRRCCHGAW